MPDFSIRIRAEDEATPVVRDVQVSMDKLGETIVDALKKAEKQAENTSSKIKKVLSFSGGAARGLFGGLVSAASFAAKGVIGAFSLVGQGIAMAFKLGVSLAKVVLNGLVAVVKSIVSAITGILNGISKVFGVVFNKVTAIVAAATTFVVAKLGQQAAAFESLDRGLDSLAKSVGTSAEAIRKAITKGSKGTVSQIDAMRLANQALLLGVAKTPQEFEELSRIALVLGQTMGIDLTNALESIIVGIGRQSKLWLDNLGIIIDTEKVYQNLAEELGVQVSALDDVQKKQAFVNATLEKGRQLVDRAGGSTAGLTVQFGQLRVALADTYTDLARLVGPALGVVAAEIVPVVQRLREWATANREVIAAKITEHTADLIEKVRALAARYEEFKVRLLDIAAVVEEKLTVAWEKTRAVAIRTFEIVKEVVRIARGEIELFIGALRGDGFDAASSVIVQGIKLIGAQAKVTALEVALTFSSAISGIIQKVTNATAFATNLGNLLSQPGKAALGAAQVSVGTVFGDDKTRLEGSRRLDEILDDTGRAGPTTQAEFTRSVKAQLEVATQQLRAQTQAAGATIQAEDATTRTMEDMIRLQIDTIANAEERQRKMAELDQVVQELAAQVQGISTAPAVIINTGG